MDRSTHPRDDVAIIGLSGLFAGSRDKLAYWQNILARRDNVCLAPASWAEPWYDREADHQGIDSARIRTRKVGLIGDLALFEPLEFGIPPRAVEGDPAHYLALQLAGDALRDAGYADRPFDRQRTGVIVGHGASPNRSDTLSMQYGLVVDQTLDILKGVLPELGAEQLLALRQALKRSLPRIEIEQAPVLVSNIISGRISNRFDLMGPSYLVDSACSSSLIALDLAVQDLRSGRCSMVLVGGVQASMPAQIYMLFQQLGALARTDIRPFDAAANGTLLGEGVGFCVLKRLADAVRDDDRIYAVVKGVGVSSDGKGVGLMAPRLEGEILAIQRAYEQTGIDPATIGLLEAHGTGIPLGDRTEIQSLTRVFGARRGRTPECAIGSVKSMIGHCIPAAGIASLIKVSLALDAKILPPTLCETVNPELGIDQTPFYVNTETRPWIHGGPLPRRAGINAFGFGGINTHAILEEYRAPEALPHTQVGRWLVERHPIQPARVPETGVSAGCWKAWPFELLVFAGDSRQAVLDQVESTLEQLRDRPDEPLADLVHRLYRAAGGGRYRLALVCSDRQDLLDKLATVREKLPGLKKSQLVSRKGLYYAEGGRPESRLAFVFSSEGSQYPNMLADLALYFPQVRGWFDFLDEVFPRTPRPSDCIFPPPTCLDEQTRDWLNGQLYAGDLATESISTASHALYELVRDLGLDCDVMIGHSAGEHVALRASGKAVTRSMALLREELRTLNQVYRELAAGEGIATGVLVSVGAVSETDIESLLQDFAGVLHLVADNCPNQVILFVTQEAREAVIGRLRQAGGIYAEMPFDRSYHTPLFASGVAALRRFYADEIELDLGGTQIFSCSTAEPYPDTPDAFLDVAASQWERPVRFQETVEALYASGVRTFVELGVSNSLTAFVDSILKGRDYLAVPANLQGRPALEQLLHMLARLYLDERPLDLLALFAHRRQPGIASVASGKPAMTMVLPGDLPRLSLDPEFAAELRRQITPASAVVSAPPESPPQPVQAPDQSGLMQVHFDLMNRFLESQTRVSELLIARMQEDGAD